MFRHHGSPFVCVVLLLFACGGDETPRQTATPPTPPTEQEAPAPAEEAATPEAPEPVAEVPEAPVAKLAEPAAAAEPAADAPAGDVKVAVTESLGLEAEDTLSVAAAVHGAAPPPPPSTTKGEEEAKGPLQVISGFDEPMAVLHDAGSDVYLVSNLNSRGPEDPGKGYISRVNPSGELEALKWIDGAAKRSKLRTPRGLAAMGERLYVADGEVIRVYDMRSGLSRGKIIIKGASRLNGLSASKKTTLYVTDAGFTDTGDPSGSDAVYQVNRAGHATALFRSSVLGHPSSVMRIGNTVWISTLGSGKLYGLDRRSRLVAGPPLEDGRLSGMTTIAEGEVVVTSWGGSAVYRGTMSSSFMYLKGGIARPGHPGWDEGRRRVLVPSQTSGEVHVISIDPPAKEKGKKTTRR